MKNVKKYIRSMILGLMIGTSLSIYGCGPSDEAKDENEEISEENNQVDGQLGKKEPGM
jgi:hypothetical protein